MAEESKPLRPQQVELLNLIRECGPNLAEIFSRLTITPETTMQDLIDTTAIVIEETVKKTRRGSR